MAIFKKIIWISKSTSCKVLIQHFVPVIWKFCKFTGPVNLQNLLFYFLIFRVFAEGVLINAKIPKCSHYTLWNQFRKNWALKSSKQALRCPNIFCTIFHWDSFVFLTNESQKISQLNNSEQSSLVRTDLFTVLRKWKTHLLSSDNGAKIQTYCLA